MPSIESRLALVYEGLVNWASGDRAAALSRWVDVCATTPARLLGFGHKGCLLPGYDADIVIFDPEVVHVIDPDSLHETAGWTPYDGVTLSGQAVTTISRGEIIADHGEWLGVPGRGRYLGA